MIMKTSGKIILGLIITTLGLAIFTAILFFRYMTNSMDKRDISEYYNSFDIGKCDSIVADGSISVNVNKNDTSGIKTVNLPHNSSDTVLVTIRGNTLYISSNDSSDNKVVPEIILNLQNIRYLFSAQHARLYVKEFSSRSLKAVAKDKSYIGLNKVSADSLQLMVFNKAKIRTENGLSLFVSAVLRDASKAELSFPIECDSLVNARRELHLKLLDKSYLNVWGSYGNMEVQRSPGAVMEVYNISGNLKDCGQSEKKHTTITINSDVN